MHSLLQFFLKGSQLGPHRDRSLLLPFSVSRLKAARRLLACPLDRLGAGTGKNPELHRPCIADFIGLWIWELMPSSCYIATGSPRYKRNCEMAEKQSHTQRQK